MPFWAAPVGGAWLLGTLFGGWIVAQWSPTVAIIGDGLSFLLMAASMVWVRLPRQVEAPGAPEPLG